MTDDKPDDKATEKPAEKEEPNRREDAKQQPGDEAEQEPEVKVVDESAYAPIVSDHAIGRLEFVRRRLPAKPWVARVFVQADGKLVVFGRDKQPTTGELLWGGFHSMYEVDLSLRRLTLEVILPSTGDAFVFRADVDIQWRVLDPELVVTTGLTDIRRVVIPLLLDRLRQATRFRLADEVEAAEKSANAIFTSDWLAPEYGIWTNVLVRLRMDKQRERNLRLESEVRVFKTLIAGGDFDQFALQLAQNPKEVGPVVEALFKERDTHRSQVFEFINQLLKSDALDRWQVDDQVRVTLEWLKASIGRVLSGHDDARRLAFDGLPQPKTNGAGGGA